MDEQVKKVLEETRCNATVNECIGNSISLTPRQTLESERDYILNRLGEIQQKLKFLDTHPGFEKNLFEFQERLR